MSQTIASVRIHVERIVALIEKFKVLKTEIPLNLNGPDHKPNMNSGFATLWTHSLSNKEIKVLLFTQSASVIIYKGQVGFIQKKCIFLFSLL